MKQVVQLKLDFYTEKIKEAEKTIVSNFVDIGKQLKEVRDNKIYKESYDTFENYVEENFSFQRRTAYNMIAIIEKNVHTYAHLGIQKLLVLMQLPEEHRQELIASGVVEDLSVRELKEVVEDKLDDIADKEVDMIINKEVEVIKSSPVEGVSDKVDMLGRALSYLSEELDNVFSGLNNLDKTDFKKEYSSNKEFYKHNFSKIEEKFDEVSEKLRKAKVLLHKLKTMRRG